MELEILLFDNWMEDYERDKMYRVHLKNISEINNCKTPVNPIAYTSRLFNFSLKKCFRKRNMLASKALQSQSQYKSSSKCHNQSSKEAIRETMVSFHTPESSKLKHGGKQKRFYIDQQNERLEFRISNASGSIHMKRYEEEYKKHKKLLNLHRKVKIWKRTVLYKIYDITFKSKATNLKEIFQIYLISPKKQDHLTQDNEFLLKGTIFELRETMIRGYRGEKLQLKIVGRSTGTVAITNDQNMFPIMHKDEIVGTLIIEMY